MKEKIMTIVWSVSLTMIGVAAFVNSVTNLLGLTLPDLAVRALGAVQMLSLVTLVYSTVRKAKAAAQKAKELSGGIVHES